MEQSDELPILFLLFFCKTFHEGLFHDEYGKLIKPDL